MNIGTLKDNKSSDVDLEVGIDYSCYERYTTVVFSATCLCLIQIIPISCILGLVAFFIYAMYMASIGKTP